ncbi:hypothetical protein [Methylobacter psychrophilus]|nr:hypothetical protein [Methylobacter psychrophilus]
MPGDIEDVEIDLGLRHKRSTPPPNYHPDRQEASHSRFEIAIQSGGHRFR